MKILQTNRRHAFTIFEGLVSGAVVLLLAATFYPVLEKQRHCALRWDCVNNLKQIGIAYRIWEGDHDDKYPMAVSGTNGGALESIAAGDVVRCYQVMSNELATPWVLICPVDSRNVPATNFESLIRSNISYFVGFNAIEADPQLMLAGDGNLVQAGSPVRAGILDLQKNTTTWTSGRHHGSGNVLITDGSVQSVRQIGPLRSGVGFGPTNRLGFDTTNSVVVP